MINAVLMLNCNEATRRKQTIDVSKNSALIPPRFGSPTSNLRGTCEPLTPNLASPYTDKTTGDNIITLITCVKN